jgi:hypothetical protein
MPCYKPLKGWRSKTINASGKRGITFKIKEALIDMPLDVPCGQCIGCRLDRSRQWALRCVHEAKFHEHNSFITLTYDDQHLTENATLDKRDFQLFLKRLRKRLGTKKIRYFMCGEYGENKAFNEDPSVSEQTRLKHYEQYKESPLGRPHYHAIIFGFDFPDRKLHTVRNGNALYTSELINSCWRKGYNTIGECNIQTCAYVARYITKKINGELQTTHYLRTDIGTGEAIQIQPEYTTMSRKPGIGKDWIDKYQSDAYPKDYITHGGKKFKPPRYYDNCLEEENIELFEKVKARRQNIAINNSDDSTLDRLIQREVVKTAQAKMLKRNLSE